MGAKGLNPKKVRFMKQYGCRYWKEMKDSPNSKITPAIIAQSVLESGWAEARWVKERNQLTATYALPEVYASRVKLSGKPIDKLRIFNSFDEYYIYKKQYYKRKGYTLDNLEVFISELSSKGYAKDPNYSAKIKKMLPQVIKLYNQVCYDSI